METLGIEQMWQSGIQFISKDSILRGQGLAKIPEPPIRPLDTEEKKKLLESSPDLAGKFTTWEHGLTPVGRLDTKTEHNLMPQTVYDQEQTINYYKDPGIYPEPRVMSLSEDEWMDLSNLKKAMYMVVFDPVLDEFIDTTGIVKEKFPDRNISLPGDVKGLLFDSSNGRTSGSISLNEY